MWGTKDKEGIRNNKYNYIMYVLDINHVISGKNEMFANLRGKYTCCGKVTLSQILECRPEVRDGRGNNAN